MPAKATLRHISLEIADAQRSRVFYDRFLPPLGFRRFAAEAEYLGYTDGTMTVWLLRSHAPRIRRRPPTGEEEVIAEHIAFHLPSASSVRSIEAALLRQELYPFFRGEVHPEFRPGYFSATWLDPDGVALELYAIGEGRSARRPARARRKPHRATRPARAARRRRGAR